MPRMGKSILASMILAAVLFILPVYARASGLPDYVLITNPDGISIGANGQYFIDAEGLQPGDVITERLVIRNLEPYTCLISMRSEPGRETGPLHLLDEVDLKLVLDGRTIYEGRARGDEGIDLTRNALDLGEYPSGTFRVLDIIMTVDPNMKLGPETSEAFFLWIFTAIRIPSPLPPDTPTEAPIETPQLAKPIDARNETPKNTPKPGEFDHANDYGATSTIEDSEMDRHGAQTDGPKTGDTAQLWLYILIGGISVSSLILLTLARKRENRR